MKHFIVCQMNKEDIKVLVLAVIFILHIIVIGEML